jgi:hypothetical protein
MNKFLFFLLVFIISSSFTTAHVDPCNTENHSFIDGEHIVYKIYYNWNFVWISAGEVDFHITETNDHYVINATGKTYASYSFFFRVNDTYKTILDKKTLLPVEFERTVEEGGYRFYNRMVFNQEAGTVMSYSGKNKDNVKAEEYQIDECMHDMLSTVYFMRNMSFELMNVNDEFPVNMFIDDKVYIFICLFWTYTMQSL